MLKMTFALTMLGSSDLERSVAFYGEILGFDVSARFGEFVFFDTGATMLALSSELQPAVKGPATHECVFGVASVTEAFERLKDRIVFLNEPRAVNAENWAVNFRDPDGHHCSFYGPK